jgi:hypothetical protein
LLQFGRLSSVTHLPFERKMQTEIRRRDLAAVPPLLLGIGTALAPLLVAAFASIGERVGAT